MANRQLVIFKIDNEEFGIGIDQVKEIINPLETFKIPDSPDYIEGLVNLRGKVYTVINLRRRFNLPYKEFDDNTKIIIVNVEPSVVGFIVDEVNEIIWADVENMEEAPKAVKDLNHKYISGIYKTSDKAIILLNLAEVSDVNQ